jgi:hypothetical protein
MAAQKRVLSQHAKKTARASDNPGAEPEPMRTEFPESVWWCIAQARKAWAAWKATDPNDDTAFNAAGDAHRRAMDTLAKARPGSAREGVKQLAFLCETARNLESPVSEVMEGCDFDLVKFTFTMMHLTEGEGYFKKCGPLAKGGKVTRDGLLQRYHSFLALELQMLGHEMYGNGRYAFSYIPMDGHVQRTIWKATDWPGHLGRDLARRAKTAMSAVGIDTVTADI